MLFLRFLSRQGLFDLVIINWLPYINIIVFHLTFLFLVIFWMFIFSFLFLRLSLWLLKTWEYNLNIIPKQKHLLFLNVNQINFLTCCGVILNCGLIKPHQIINKLQVNLLIQYRFTKDYVLSNLLDVDRFEFLASYVFLLENLWSCAECCNWCF